MIVRTGKIYGGEVLEAVLAAGAKRATKYISETEVIKATRKTFKRGHRRQRTTQIVVTVGKPNYEERKFIVACRKSGERFPMRRIQLKWPKAK